MPTSPSSDPADLHSLPAAAAFNRAWDLIELAERTDEETAEMIDAAHASAWHWRYRDDRSATSDAVGAWQLSRVYALAGEASRSEGFGRKSLEVSQSAGLPPFYVGYAHEALARAALDAGDLAVTQRHLTSARELLEQVENDDDNALLAADLSAIESMLGDPGA